MNTNYLKKLEFDKILQNLSEYCHTYIGREKALSLEPSSDKEFVKKILSETSQAVSLIDRNSTPPLSEIEDIRVYIKMLESSNTLTAKALLDICNILEMADELKAYFSNFLDDESYENLRIYFDELYTNHSVVDKIKKSIIDYETIADNASSTLSSIRRHIRQAEQDIKNKLNSILHSSYAKYMQENVVTIRNDRFVIPVKQEYRSQIKGFVHDISSTGSTVFIEPISVFEANNTINNLKVDEAAEIERILQNLSSLLFPYTNELFTNIEAIGTLDFIFAKSRYSNSIKGITPVINDTKYINLIKARHPLIEASKVVPITINIGNNYNLLIITGPNTGGKTVCLKTVGLLEAMACSGLNIPAEEKSSVYVFDEIYADIGDDQSIADSLSTFSSHMKNISHIVESATPESLILVDELGSGTDPLEGANLAISILEFFKNSDILCLATTHYQELKKYALVTEDVQNASVEFDIENLKPTYKLLIGIPGKSNAFAISEKLGLKKEIIEKAQNLLDKKDIDFETLLKSIYDDKIKIEKEKSEIEKNLHQVQLLKESLKRDDSRVREQEKEIINKAKLEARQILLDAKDDATSMISKMKEISEASSELKELNNMRNSLNNSIKNISLQGNDELNVTPLDENEIVIGAKVFVSTLGQNGIVLSKISKSKEVQVQIGLIKTNIPIKFLEKPKNIKNDLSTSKTTASYGSSVSKTRTANSEINVIGLTVDEAIPLVDKFLDDCFLAKLQTARIVHGKGTGKLRQGIHSFLKKNKRVKSFRVGTYGEGEMGVTIVELK
ncbi:MAG: endonuclease MutS2 [Clostridia bacterium]|nr:endonuclease MutS2 [Clostridia bacterium]